MSFMENRPGDPPPLRRAGGIRTTVSDLNHSSTAGRFRDRVLPLRFKEGQRPAVDLCESTGVFLSDGRLARVRESLVCLKEFVLAVGVDYELDEGCGLGAGSFCRNREDQPGRLRQDWQRNPQDGRHEALRGNEQPQEIAGVCASVSDGLRDANGPFTIVLFVQVYKY